MANHIDCVNSKCHGLLGVLRRASKVLPRDLLKLAYTSLVRSHLEYGSALFTSAAPSHLKKLDVIQKIASRIITNTDSRAHSAPLQVLLGLEPLAERRSNHVKSIVNNIIEDKIHPYFSKYFELGGDSTSALSTISKLEKKRFIHLGKSYYDETIKNRLTYICDLQLPLEGRLPSTVVQEQSATYRTIALSSQASSHSASADYITASQQLEAPD